MTETDATRLRKRAVKDAMFMGFENDAEDLAHDTLLNYIEHPGNTQPLTKAVIDSIRKKYGRGKSSYKGKLKPDSFQKKFKDSLFSIDVESKAVKNLSSLEQNSLLDFENLIGGCDGIERAMICLYYIWGFELKEIGACFDMYDTQVCHIMNQAIGRMKIENGL